MKIYNFASSSSGNCSLVCTESTKLLVDIGMSVKKLKEFLSALDMLIEDISAVLITHEHSDHIRGLGTLSRKYGLPIYATRGTIYEIVVRAGTGAIPDVLFHEITEDNEFQIGNIRILPLEVSHDAVQPVAFRFNADERKAAIITDLGCYDVKLVNKLKDLHVIVLEANHDVNILQAGRYPFALKKRILSNIGHLSNESAAKFLQEIISEDLHDVILGHLSKENNLPQLALKYMENAVFETGLANRDRLNIRVAPIQDIMCTEV